jgi:hypothetical protein
MAKEAKFSISEDDASTKEFSDPWRTPDIKQSWDITGNAMVRDAGDVLHDLLNGKEKWDVTIGQEVGKLPRKMKKALHSKRMSKWKHKVASYISRRQVRIHDAEMVVTPDQFDTLKATTSAATASTSPTPSPTHPTSPCPSPTSSSEPAFTSSRNSARSRSSPSTA